MLMHEPIPIADRPTVQDNVPVIHPDRSRKRPITSGLEIPDKNATKEWAAIVAPRTSSCAAFIMPAVVAALRPKDVIEKTKHSARIISYRQATEADKRRAVALAALGTADATVVALDRARAQLSRTRG